MPKDALYFSHDFGARNDPKLQDVQIQMGMEGIGIYWCVVEMLYEQGGYLPVSALRGMAFSMHVDEAKVTSIIEDFGLFSKTEDGLFYSSSALARIEKKRRVSEARAAAGRLGGIASGQARSNSQANAEQMPGIFDQMPEAPEAPQVPAPAPVADHGDTAVVDMIIAKSGPSTQATLQSYTGPRSDIETFFAIFHFEKDVASAQGEVARFIKQYQPNSWCRRGTQIPVTDRAALARAYDQVAGYSKAYTDARPLSYLRQVYERLRASGNPERWRLIWEVRDMSAASGSDGAVHFKYTLSSAAADLINAVGLSIEGIKISYNKL